MTLCSLLVSLLLVSIGTLPVRSAVIPPVIRTFGNLTVTKVVTATEPTTTTKSALFTCTTLAAPLLAATPCRRKKQLWGVPVFYTVAHEDIDQFHSLNPTHVFKVEPSVLEMPEESPSSEVRPGVWVIEPSLEASGSAFRFAADPHHLFSAFFSSLLVSGWRFLTIPVVTFTRTVYTATSTATLFTSTSVHTLSAAPCLPADFASCPWEIGQAPATDDPSTEDPSTDVL